MSDLAARLWSRVDKSGDCWRWIGGHTFVDSGALKVDGRTLSARRVAWQLVNGVWPSGRLEATCRTPSCLRPSHMIERTRLPDQRVIEAKAGWPFDFRDFATSLMGTSEAESELLPVLLYRGNLSLGRAQSLFNLTLAAQRLGMSRGSDWRDGTHTRSLAGRLWVLTREYPDLTHSVGMHGPLTAYNSLPRFWWRLRDNPDTLRLRPGLAEFVERALDSVSNFIWPLDRISLQSYWSKRDWRRTKRDGRGPRSRQSMPSEPLPMVWPFQTEPTSDQDLIRQVDAVVPKTLPEFVRQEVCQDLILAVLEQTTALDELRGEPTAFIADVFRRYPTKYGPLSLEAPLPGYSEADGINLGAFLGTEELIA